MYTILCTTVYYSRDVSIVHNRNKYKVYPKPHRHNFKDPYFFVVSFLFQPCGT